jgi:hypothetical protein
MSSKTYDPERVAKLAEIATKFTSHAMVGDEIVLGIAGDPEMPARYRNGARPKGVITRIKNEGTEHATLRVHLDTGKTIDLAPHNISGERVWEFTDASWAKVLARNSEPAPKKNAAYRGSASSSGDELSSLREQLSSLSAKYDRDMAEAKEFNSALVDSIAQITGEVVQTNPNAKFSRVFQSEYKGMSKNSKEASPFDSDIDDDEY